MPKFYFDFRDNGHLTIDDVGLQFAGFEQAYLEAFRASQEIWYDHLKQGKDPTLCAFEICDASHNLLLVLPFVEILSDGGANPKLTLSKLILDRPISGPVPPRSPSQIARRSRTIIPARGRAPKPHKLYH